MKMEQSEFESMRVAIGRRDTGAIRQFRWEGTAILLYRSITSKLSFL